MRCVEKDLKKIAGLGHIFFLLYTTYSFNLVYEDCLVNRKTTKAIPDLTKWIEACKLVQRYLKNSPLLL
jgi:hypothetical protein